MKIIKFISLIITLMLFKLYLTIQPIIDNHIVGSQLNSSDYNYLLFKSWQVFKNYIPIIFILLIILLGISIINNFYKIIKNNINKKGIKN